MCIKLIEFKNSRFPMSDPLEMTFEVYNFFGYENGGFLVLPYEGLQMIHLESVRETELETQSTRNKTNTFAASRVNRRRLTTLFTNINTYMNCFTDYD